MFLENLKKFFLWIIVFLLILGVGALRVYKISQRPMHCDEANQAYKTGVLLERGLYKYDPYEHHGPFLYYATLPVFWLYGIKTFPETTEIMYRIVPVFFSLLLFLLLLPLRNYFGTVAFCFSFLFLSFSNAFFFYSRYYIHEMAFVFFSALFTILVWNYLLHPSHITALIGGIVASLAFATKETSIITIPSALLAGLCVYTIRIKLRVENGNNLACLSLRRFIPHIILFMIGFIPVWLFFYSSFFTNWAGLIDFFRAYIAYIVRASGKGSSGIHDKPWWYYLQIITYFNKTVGPIWTELHILIPSAVGVIAVLSKIFKSTLKKATLSKESLLGLHLFISYLLPFALLSLIPYKTPWNILYPMFGIILFSGIGISKIIEIPKKISLRMAILLLFLLSTLHLVNLTYQGNFIYYADVSNPYVYAHTSTSLVKMMNRIYELSDILKSEKEEPIVLVIDPSHDYWPIPWYLRKISKKGFYSEVPEEIDEVKILVVSPKIQDKVNEKLSLEKYMIFTYSIRPSELRYLYVEKSLWGKFMESRR
ncbi:MAG: TIGR03663 family protein [Candidatus Hydrogenedentes bacterium]|nr:TIGR03663 family protein [Candidatus Hydrogenedentota bacterium]